MALVQQLQFLRQKEEIVIFPSPNSVEFGNSETFLIIFTSLALYSAKPFSLALMPHVDTF